MRRMHSWPASHCFAETLAASLAGGSGGSETGDFTVVVQYHAPCVLPWIWDAARPAGSGTLQSQPIPLRAGADGASGRDNFACRHRGNRPAGLGAAD